MERKLDSARLAFAALLTYIITFVICSAFVAIAPKFASRIATDITHIQISGDMRAVDWPGLFVGLIAGAIVVYLIIWLAAALYNGLPGKKEAR